MRTRIIAHGQKETASSDQDWLNVTWLADRWNFSPQGTTSEAEDHYVELPAVTVLELNFTRNISGGNAVASLAQLRLA